MRGKMAGSLGLVLGFMATGAFAQSPAWTSPPGGSRSAAVSLGRPVIATTTPAAPAPGAGVALDRPVAFQNNYASSVVDPQLHPVLYTDVSQRPLVRAKGPDEPQRLPSGPSKDIVAPRIGDDLTTQNADKPASQPELLHPPKTDKSASDKSAIETGPIVEPGKPITKWEGACDGISCDPCPGPGCCDSCCPCPTGSCCPCPSGRCCTTCPSSTCCNSCPTGIECNGCSTTIECNGCPSGIMCDNCTCGLDGCCTPGSCCGNCMSDCCGGCCDPNDFWFRAEYLLWHVRKGPAPPLVATGPPTTGTLGATGLTTLFGGPLDYEEQSGARFTAGYWFDRCHDFGIEGDYFFLTERHVNFAASSPGSPVLVRPFFNVITMRPDVEIVASPSTVTVPGGGTMAVTPVAGTVLVSSSSRLQGADLNGIFNIGHNGLADWGLLGPGRTDVIAGFRFLQLEENLNIAEDLTATPAGAGPVHIQVFDSFATRNQFYGGQIGLRRQWSWNRWTLDVTGKVALGDTHQSLDVNGTTLINGVPTTRPGGLLALDTNIGNHSHDTFSVVPEIGLNVGYQVTQRIRVFAGYNFLYWTNVARPGAQIDAINPTHLPLSPVAEMGPARPMVTFKQSDFWAQGINAGLEFKF